MGKLNKSTGKDQVINIHKIDVRVPQRSSMDIETWRTAMRTFENLQNPNRAPLYDLYDDILIDGKVISTWGKRKDNILNKELLYVKDGVEDEDIGRLLNSNDMRNFLSDLMDTLLYGYTVIQINSIFFDADQETYKIDYDLIPRKHVHPERNFECISFSQSSISKDILYKEDPWAKYLVFAGDPSSKGILLSVCQYVIYKRGDIGDWAQYAEMFGMPFRDCTYDDFDDNTRIALEMMNQQWAGAPYIVRPKSSGLDLKTDAGKSGSEGIYKSLYEVCNAEIAQIMLNNTLTSEQGEKGARALGDVHQESEAEKLSSDEKFILDILSTKFRAVLKRFGFNVTGGNIWFKSAEADWEVLNKKWEVIGDIRKSIPVADDFIYEEFDIPKPENYEELKSKLSVTSGAILPEQPTLPKDSTIIDKIRRFFGQAPRNGATLDW